MHVMTIQQFKTIKTVLTSTGKNDCTKLSGES